MIKRRELFIEADITQFFINFYEEYHGTTQGLGIYPGYGPKKKAWLMFEADDEFMVLAVLKFNPTVMDPWGTAIDFTD